MRNQVPVPVVCKRNFLLSVAKHESSPIMQWGYVHGENGASMLAAALKSYDCAVILVQVARNVHLANYLIGPIERYGRISISSEQNVESFDYAKGTDAQRREAQDGRRECQPVPSSREYPGVSDQDFRANTS
jgi:hypothetical protein